MKYVVRLLQSFFWDIRYIFESGLRRRVQYADYRLYVAAKLYPLYMKQGNAAAFIADVAQRYCVGNGVDVGAGQWPMFGARAVEDDVLENAYSIGEGNETLDYVFSSHLLEHLDKPAAAIEEWSRVLKPGGFIFIYVPHPVCEMWSKDLLKFHVWNPYPADLVSLINGFSELEVVDQDGRPDIYMSHYIVAKKIS